MTIDFSNGKWINEPKEYQVTKDRVELRTDPNTDFWQRSYYGFRNDNAPALLIEKDENFSFSFKVSFEYQGKYDQCGAVIYIDKNNWFKASIEYETEEFSRLGSVVTNDRYSDWATTDIQSTDQMWYRLSRRGPDFLIESSRDGEEYSQMRVFHLHQLGETTEEMGKLNPPLAPEIPVSFGVYACSPLASSFTAIFENMKYKSCKWLAHG